MQESESFCWLQAYNEEPTTKQFRWALRHALWCAQKNQKKYLDDYKKGKIKEPLKPLDLHLMDTGYHLTCILDEKWMKENLDRWDDEDREQFW